MAFGHPSFTLLGHLARSHSTLGALSSDPILMPERALMPTPMFLDSVREFSPSRRLRNNCGSTLTLRPFPFAHKPNIARSHATCALRTLTSRIMKDEGGPLLMVEE
ncbi:uncharacterized protein N7473_001710 [Penicillium subrubescens]|uniref:uncharacterized protein n=1 Tax=Penicillium subrubescens TaxID=1316194 RepID=UPI00254559AF|nr:uncharacterized protein N7473_001710 [Penicillium subrubescens]KAJ5904794.1 hypothetical protein N7473_001710 [Penicillium subrubescens]